MYKRPAAKKPKATLYTSNLTKNWKKKSRKVKDDAGDSIIPLQGSARRTLLTPNEMIESEREWQGAITQQVPVKASKERERVKVKGGKLVMPIGRSTTLVSVPLLASCIRVHQVTCG